MAAHNTTLLPGSAGETPAFPRKKQRIKPLFVPPLLLSANLDVPTERSRFHGRAAGLLGREETGSGINGRTSAVPGRERQPPVRHHFPLHRFGAKLKRSCKWAKDVDVATVAGEIVVRARYQVALVGDGARRTVAANMKTGGENEV